MGTIHSPAQTRWKDCFATSERARLTLRTNGEEETYVIAPDNTVVRAGFERPETAASAAASAGGALGVGYYVYRYVYASSRYPYVENAVTMGGESWPRSNPSDPSSAVQATGGNLTIDVTVTKTTRSDVDTIAVYRTLVQTTAALAEAEDAAGNLFYLGTLVNDGYDGTGVFEDDGGDTPTTERVEFDNELAPTAQFCVFDGTYWWMCGNYSLDVEVTLDGTATIAIGASEGRWFNGRDGQVINFDGITTGGFDNKGSFYFGYTTETTATLYRDRDLTNSIIVPFSGTTTAHIRGLASTLWRSKPFNPFSWGQTEEIIDQDGNVLKDAGIFFVNMGGGSVTALAVAANGKRLKVDFENPQRTITYDLQQADQDTFGATQFVLDDTGSVTSHFAQFNGYLRDVPLLFGLDLYNGNILVSDGYKQIVASDELAGFLLELDNSNNASRLFHGGYDPVTELNCFWVRYYETDEVCNVLVWVHAATGYVSWMPDFNVSCNALVLDDLTRKKFMVGGTENGHIGRLFNIEFYDNWMNGLTWRYNVVESAGASGSLETNGYEADNFSPQAITSEDLPNLQFTVSGTPTCAVGDSVVLFDNSGNSKTVVVVAISGSVVTVNESWSDLPFGANFVITTSERSNGMWATIIQTDGLSWWHVKLEAGLFTGQQCTWTITQYIERGSSTIQVPDSVSVPWTTGDLIFFGCIPTLYRSYFDGGAPVQEKLPVEVWCVADNVQPFLGDISQLFESNSEPPFLTCRYFAEYDATGTQANTFAMNQVDRPDSTGSMVWFARQLPDGAQMLINQFGFEFSEVGFDAFTIYNFTVKLQPNV